MTEVKRKITDNDITPRFFTISELQGNLGEIIKSLIDLQKELGDKGYFEIDVEIFDDYYEYYNHDELSVRISGTRFETEDEKTKRIEKSRKAKATRKKNNAAKKKKKIIDYLKMRQQIEGPLSRDDIIFKIHPEYIEIFDEISSLTFSENNI